MQKKREIFLANMNINIKKEETNRLEDFIKNEEESLKARELVKFDWFFQKLYKKQSTGYKKWLGFAEKFHE